MKNEDFQSFVESLKPNHDVQFTLGGYVYTINIGEKDIYVNITNSNGELSGFEYSPESSSYEELIEKFINEPLFNGKSLKEEEGKVHVDMYW